ncbi:MAG: C39 family peptidase [Actinomycetota bacterium]|nr:C39 family peptidase [Actinomycetota bacterium]
MNDDPTLTADPASDLPFGPDDILDLPWRDLLLDSAPVEHPAVGDNDWVDQKTDGLCVPASVAMIVAAFGGQPSSAALQTTVADAERLGLLTRDGDGYSGMTPDGAVALLAGENIPAHVETGGSIDDLQQHLSDGDAVILWVDSHELPLWNETDEVERPDHAVVIKEIDTKTGLVYLEDPGHPQGRAEILTIDELQRAWDDSNDTMIVTDAAPQDEGGFVLLPILIDQLLHA